MKFLKISLNCSNHSNSFFTGFSEFNHCKISPFSFEKFLPLSDTMIKFVISSKEDNEQVKSNLKNFYLLNKTCPSYLAV